MQVRFLYGVLVIFNFHWKKDSKNIQKISEEKLSEPDYATEMRNDGNQQMSYISDIETHMKYTSLPTKR